MAARDVAPAPADLNLTENARKVLEARYLKKNEAGDCTEAPADLFHRVAGCIADVERRYGATDDERNQWAQRYFDLMGSGQFMPNSPTLMNAGREMGMLSACFVLPVRDSIVEIFDTIKHTALIQKAGGGTGFAFDELRPTGDFIQSSGGTTSGPISFWKAFSEATNAIQQGAFRRGANMGMMYVHHPDILKFLHAKQDLSQFTNYNISVKMTDEWMRQFLADPDSPQICRNPRNGQAYLLPRDLDIWKYDVRSLVEIDCVEPVDADGREAYYTTPTLIGDLPEELRGKFYTKRDIWEIIIRNAWQTGEPGVVFMDRINQHNPTPHIGRMEATNPCGEQPLLPYEACNLGSINLGLFVKDACSDDARVDWEALRAAVHLSTRYLDNVIDANNYPLAEIDHVCKHNRKIGLGIMGFADALYKLGVPYNSDEGVEWGERFMKFVDDEAHNFSEYLARCRGCFPNWKGSTWQTRHNRQMRNACCTTVAPTGTISIIANCSGGIEPMFSLAFIRNVLRGSKQGEKPLVEVNDTFRDVARQRGFLSDALLERIAAEGTLAHIDDVPADIKRVFVCAHDITPEWHMRMQAAFQRHCDSSISKTINFPNAAAVEDVDQIYRQAFELDCKGVTVYRDGCRSFQPMALKESGKETRARVQGESAEDAESAEDVAAAVTLTVGATTEAGAAQVSEREAQASADGATLSLSNPARPAIAGAPHNGSREGTSRESEAPAEPPARMPLRQTELTARMTGGSMTTVPTFPPSHVPPALEPMDLPELLSSFRMRQITPFGNMHVHITVDPRSQRELEVFAQLGKGGDVANSDLEAICRMISLWLRAGGGLRQVVKQLEGIGSSLQIPTRAGRIMSLGDGLACALKRYTRAKEHFGLRPMLLGEVDLAQLDAPAPPHVPTPAALNQRPTPPATGDRTSRESEARESETREGEAPAELLRRSAPSRLEAPPTPNAGPRSVATATPTPLSASTASGRPVPAPTTTPFDAPSGGNGHGESHRHQEGNGNGTRLGGALAMHEATGHAALVLDTAAAPPPPVVAAQAATATLDIAPSGLSIASMVEMSRLANQFLTLDRAVDIAAEVADDYAVESLPVPHRHDSAEHYKLRCPECGQHLALQEGCRKCLECGWSAC